MDAGIQTTLYLTISFRLRAYACETISAYSFRSFLSLKFFKEVDLVHPVRGDMFIDCAETSPPAPSEGAEVKLSGILQVSFRPFLRRIGTAIQRTTSSGGLTKFV
jgi:hypothetical protein